jgi:hypothetical protein
VPAPPRPRARTARPSPPATRARHSPATAGNYTCNPDFNVSQLGLLTRWTPVKNLTFSGEVQWFHLDQKMSGSSVFTATAPKPNALYEFKDQDTVLLQFRAQRNF